MKIDDELAWIWIISIYESMSKTQREKFSKKFQDNLNATTERIRREKEQNDTNK